MVSKIIKKTPTKSIRDCRSRSQPRYRRKSSPVKNAAAAATSLLVESINKSILTCQRRLLKIFSKLVCFSTPNHHKAYKILNKTTSEEAEDRAKYRTMITRRTLVFDNDRLPPLISPTKRTVFLDLDETLIHSKLDPPPERYDFVVRPRIDGEVVNFYVLKRPGVDEFLESLARKFEIVVFTAGLKEYASLVINELDKKSVISHRLYRDSCRELEGKFVKDLSEMGRDLKRVAIVDDNPNAYSLQPENAIPIPSFTDDPNDTKLKELMNFFDKCDCFDDMREAVIYYLIQEDEKLNSS